MPRRDFLHRLAAIPLGSALTSAPTTLASTPAHRGAEAPLSPALFPAMDRAVFLSGELAVLDPINRRAGLRIDCALRDDKRASEGPLHYFAMLPCGEIWFHGAPATFQDILPGTHIQGYFFPPPAGEEHTIAPPPKELASLIPAENHALLLEDDLSFSRRQGFRWKILSIARDASKLQVQSVGATPAHGPSGTLLLDFDSATRVWEKGRAVPLDRLEPGQTVSINFGRAVNWNDHEFGTHDIWLDEESIRQCTELQDQRNVRYHRIRWLPGVIESVSPFDYGGGHVTIALFGGVSRTLLDDLYKDRHERIAVAAAEPTLRTWRHRGDRVFGKLRNWEHAEPFPGFSGARLHLKFTELLDHFQPGNAVRVKAESWLFITNTPEERIKSLEDRALSRTLRLPGQVPPEDPTPGQP